MIPVMGFQTRRGDGFPSASEHLPRWPLSSSRHYQRQVLNAPRAGAEAAEPEFKRLYRAFARREPSLPIFSRDWWLDAVAGSRGWDVVVATRGGEIAAAMPYQPRRRLGLRWLSQPPLTPWLGPWLRPSAAKSSVALAQEKDLMEELIEALPRFDYFTQNWHHARSNWLPFYWRGFKGSTRYSYVLPDLQDEAVLWADLDKSVRSTIRKAEKRFKLRVRRDLDVDAFLSLNRMTYARQGKKPPYDDALVRRLDAACEARRCRQILIAVDDEGRAHAGEYMVWDENSAYALMGGADPDLRHSGATSLCLWEAIRQAARVTGSYDFCGSMIEGVERQFRSFGAGQTPYFHITKANNALLRFVL